MTALVGRDVFFGSGTTALTVARTKSLSISNEPVDITSDDDLGFRTLLATKEGQRSADVSIEGVTKDSTLIASASGTGSKVLTSYKFDIPGVGSITGNWFITSIEIGAPYNDAVTFSASLQSSGSFTYAAAGGGGA